ncbi:hypothetical protein L596_009179 [Steinernema carpocapsae]|uniref:Homeobox domain-containing protein n=1 Tax=Steinernema carpocapsae TaxID=34508 RepID=A0A4U5PF50_STECR|nr:hypothetical protein L596_009179 [Steinernema carpocapsae]
MLNNKTEHTKIGRCSSSGIFGDIRCLTDSGALKRHLKPHSSGFDSSRRSLLLDAPTDQLTTELTMNHSAIDIVQVGKFVWDFEGRVYDMENAVFQRSVGSCATKGCKGILYVHREPLMTQAYLIAEHTELWCDRRAPEKTKWDSLTERADALVQVSEVKSLEQAVKKVDKAVQSEALEKPKMKKCVFRVELRGNIKDTSFNVVQNFYSVLSLIEAIGENVCAPTGSLCFVEVSRWDSDFRVYSKMSEDDILDAYCEENAKYKITCHVGEPEATAIRGWMVKVEFLPKIEAARSSTSKTYSVSTFSESDDSLTSVYPKTTSSSTSFTAEEDDLETTHLLSSSDVPVVMTKAQREFALEKEFKANSDPNQADIVTIALKLRMPIAEVRSWFIKRSFLGARTRRSSTSC